MAVYLNFEVPAYGAQGGTFTCLTWISKPTVSCECALSLSLGICTTLVELVLSSVTIIPIDLL